MIFGYTRISTGKKTQKHDRQDKALLDYAQTNDFKIDTIYQDIITGSTKAQHRPEYGKLREILRKGDVLLLTDIDRLGRNADDTIKELKELKERGIRVVALDVPHMNIWNNATDESIYNMIIDIVITLKAHIAQQEKEKLVARINQGLEVARAKGKKLGRPAAELPNDFIKQYLAFKNGEYGKMSASSLAKMLGVGRSTLYKYINIYEKQTK